MALSAFRPIINSYPQPPTTSGRVLALLGGLTVAATFVPTAFLSLFLLGLSAQSPDSTVADGDPCCPHPDTWLEALGGTLGGVLGLLFGAALLSAAFACCRWSVTGRRLGTGRALGVGSAAAVTLYIAAVLAVVAGA